MSTKLRAALEAANRQRLFERHYQHRSSVLVFDFNSAREAQPAIDHLGSHDLPSLMQGAFSDLAQVEEFTAFVIRD